MSAGGVFKLIANDGKADRMIMATELLNQRIKDIMCMRARQGASDPTPTLVDLERTHILFMNAHFKPFASIGYEYNKVRTNSGNPTFNNSVQFSIPQFGDFFNDMVVNVNLDATSATPGVVPAFGPFVGTDLQTVGVTSQTSGTQNTTTGVYTKYTQEYVNSNGVAVAPGSPASNFVRYAEYVGERIFRKVTFTVNGNPLDDYDSTAMMFHQKFRVQPNKEVGWARLVGQEVPIEGYTNLQSISGASPYPANVVNLQYAVGGAVLGAPVTAATTARQLVQVLTGHQTPQAVQPALDLWVPLIFWFNKDPRLSIPSVSIPYGQRFIDVFIEQQDNLLFVAPGNLYARLTVETQLSNDAGTKGTANAIAVTNVQKYITLTPVLAQGSTINNAQQIKAMDLYINNIFVNPEIHDIYIKRIGFSLIRVHRYQSNRLAVANESVLLAQLKWPVETIFTGLRPIVNVDASNVNQWRDWHRLTLLTDNVLRPSAQAAGDVMTDDTIAFNATNIKHKTFSSQWSNSSIVFPTSTRTVETLQVQAQGINIFAQTNQRFFRDYLPYTFGGNNIVTPQDEGAFMVNFCLYPGTYQPSGHINVSRAREFYINFTSLYCDSTHPADLLVLAICINFLLISDGSAVLRYST